MKLRMSQGEMIRFRAARKNDCIQILRADQTAAFILRERDHQDRLTGYYQVWILQNRNWKQLASASALAEALVMCL